MIYLFAIAWASIGMGLYHCARRGWIADFGTDNAPFNYVIAAVLGVGMAGPAIIQYLEGRGK